MSKHDWPEEPEQEQETTAVSTETETETDDTSKASEKTATATAAMDEAGEPDEADEASEVVDFDEAVEAAEAGDVGEASTFARVLAFGILPVAALLLAAGAGYLKWVDNSVRLADTARIESLQAAKDITVKMLSYKPDTVEQDMQSARDLITGSFRDAYIKLTDEQVIPGSKQQQISAVATVPAAASISAKAGHAEALVFVNQTVIVGQSAPTAMASSVKVTLDQVGDRWLISSFDPV